MITVKRYKASDGSIWNYFVTSSANATFILDRRFLEYHKDRFTDHSLLLYQKNKLLAVFPANQSKAHITSHGGLTYGGLIVAPTMKLFTTLSCFYAVTRYYWRKGFKTIFYKPVPSFFHTVPFHQDIYALFLLKSTLFAVNTGFVAQLDKKPHLSTRRMRQVKKAITLGMQTRRASDCRLFWNEILIPHLAKRFGAKPVHTVDEIEMLRARFPANIIQYVAMLEGKMVAGTTLFIDRGVAHSQYIASTDRGRQTGGLDYLFWHLITHEYADYRIFSLGTTNMGSPDGRTLSIGLTEWKEHFGTYMVPYPCYSIETKNHRMLEAYR